MLCITRKLGEKVFIGPDIFVQIIEIGRGKVKLGIEALKDVNIWREEIMPENDHECSACNQLFLSAADLTRWLCKDCIEVQPKNAVCPDCGRGLAGAKHYCPKNKGA